MPSSYTSSLRLELPVTGELTGNWGNRVNDGITALVDAAVAGTAAVVHDDTPDYSLTSNNAATDQARQIVLNVTGTLTADRNIVCPAVSKLYMVVNGTTGGFAITIKTPLGTGVSIAAGQTAFVYCDTANVLSAFSYLDVLTLGAPLSLLSGGTGSVDAAGARTNLAVAGIAVPQTFAGGQAGAIVELTDLAAIVVNLSLANNFNLVLTGNAHNMELPTNIVAGQSGSIFITQAATGGPYTLSWNTVWKFQVGSIPIITADPGASDRVDYIVKSATEIHAVWSGDYK